MAFITTSYPAQPDDAAGHFVAAEARAEAARGARVIVLAPGSGAPDPASANPRVIRIPDHGLFGWPGALARLSANPLRSVGAIRFALGARRRLRQLGPFDRVVAHWIIPSGWPIAGACRAPLEVVVHGSDVRLVLRLPAALRKAIIGRLLEHGARFRFVSDPLRSQLCRGALRDLRQRSVVAPCALELPVTPSRSEARRRLGVAPSQALAVIVARLVVGKRVDVALGALDLLDSARVVVVGDGPLQRSLASRFPGAEFVGKLGRERTLLWIAAADVLVSASRQEGAPTVVREARALGTPVVAAPAGDLRSWAATDPLITVISDVG